MYAEFVIAAGSACLSLIYFITPSTHTHTLHMSWWSSDSVVTGWPRKFSVLYNLQAEYGFNSATYPVGTRVKVAGGPGGNNHRPSGHEIKITWSCTSALPVVSTIHTYKSALRYAHHAPQCSLHVAVQYSDWATWRVTEKHEVDSQQGHRTGHGAHPSFSSLDAESCVSGI